MLREGDRFVKRTLSISPGEDGGRARASETGGGLSGNFRRKRSSMRQGKKTSTLAKPKGELTLPTGEKVGSRSTPLRGEEGKFIGGPIRCTYLLGEFVRTSVKFYFLRNHKYSESRGSGEEGKSEEWGSEKENLLYVQKFRQGSTGKKKGIT